MKRFIFHAAALLPLALIVAAPLHFFFTNLPQRLYIASIRNIPFECMRSLDTGYVYGMKPGPCRLKNIEYDVVLTHDADGFRNPRAEPDPQVAVIGDSHAHGFGVRDHETFADRLEAVHGYRARNLGVTSLATLRELEILAAHGKGAKYVVLQYCDNDAGENKASLWLSRGVFRSMVDLEWHKVMASYAEGKAAGLRKPLTDLAVMLKDGDFASKPAWRAQQIAGRDLAEEASAFVDILALYRPVLEGRRLIVFESSGWGFNAPGLPAAFGAALKRLPWLDVHIIDSSKLLTSGDYYFLDDHLNAKGHAKLATAVAAEIAGWEKAAPLVGPTGH
jgi:hypothetical protein